MSTRRPHTKSQLGCIRCKEKHVKCDEVRPICGACARNKVPCILKSSANRGKTATSNAKRTRSTNASPASIPDTVHQPAHDALELAETSLPLLSNQPGVPRSGFSLWEFDLLHHYTIHVTDTFDLTPRLHNLWRDRAVREATRHEFLLHMTLMISCLHLALTKSPRYADSHHRFILSGCSNAMSWFQQEMEHVDESNFRAVGPFAFLMCVYGLALPLVDETRKIADMVLDDMIQVLGLLRGTENLVKGTRQHDEQDDEPWSNEEDLRDISANISKDFDIESVVRTLRAYVSSSDDDARVRVVNYKAIHGFETSSDLNFKLYLRPFIWPNFIDLEYLDLLKQRNPIAMVILAHYAITLGQCSSQWWCAD